MSSAGRLDRGRAAVGRLLRGGLRRQHGDRAGGTAACDRADHRQRRTGRDGAVVHRPRAPADAGGRGDLACRGQPRGAPARGGLPGRAGRHVRRRAEPGLQRLVPRLRAAPSVLPRDDPAPRPGVRSDLQRDRRGAGGVAQSQAVRRADRARHRGLRGLVLVRVQPLDDPGDRAEPGPGRAHRATGVHPGRTRRGPSRGRRASGSCSRPPRPAWTPAAKGRSVAISTWRWPPRARTWPRPGPWSPRSPRPRWRRPPSATRCTG